jgi:diguanylate cyclase (GGDEF)-like protein
MRFSDDPREEGALADFTSGLMWLITGLVGIAVLALPGSPREHLAIEIGLGIVAAGWGAISLWLARTRRTMTIGVRALVTAACMPIVAAALWATGGASSFVQPPLLFTTLFVAYFFPPRLAWPLVLLFAATFLTPLLYDPAAVEQGYPARTVTFMVAVVGMTLIMQFLKRRLLHAEARQRVMAERDPLTGLHNRRSFDAALAQDGPAVLVLFDLDEFKAINDVHGHPVGDEVLRAVAGAAQSAVRDGDRLARIGGDEFALVARGARRDGAERIVAALEAAVADAPIPAPIDRIGISVAWASYPDDADTPAALFAAADARLMQRKRAGKRLVAHGYLS